jgi:exonuclease III
VLREYVRIGTLNIRNGRRVNMEIAMQAIAHMNVDVAVLTETRLKDERYAKYVYGYEITATKAKYKIQGGIALVYWSSKFW